ncbi:MAG: T9SS type A sorting domain-containing protein [Lewinellaceae bacterium]|nr:T9SS type A sorting domain-containing protein [Lewinellaceae bacterium]
MVDHLRIRLPEGWTNANLMVFNASGQRVLTQENVANEAWIATSAWPAGLYWAKIKTGAKAGCRCENDREAINAVLRFVSRERISHCILIS